MRILLLLSLVTIAFATQPSTADDKEKLYGVWKLTSFKLKIVGENESERDVWGPNPKGYLILMPNGRMMALVTAANRKPPTNDADSAMLQKTMSAYTGKYTIEGDKWTTVVDLHHNEIWVGQPPQVRYFKVEGNKLTVRVPEQPSGLFPGKRITSTLEWVREE
jgi:hypothetical protein